MFTSNQTRFRDDSGWSDDEDSGGWSDDEGSGGWSDDEDNGGDGVVGSVGGVGSMGIVDTGKIRSGVGSVHPAPEIDLFAEILNRLFVYLRGLGRSITPKIENRK